MEPSQSKRVRMIEIEDQTVTNKLMQDASKKIRVFQENESGYELISQHGILENRDPDGNLCLYLKKKPFEPVKDKVLISDGENVWIKNSKGVEVSQKDSPDSPQPNDLVGNQDTGTNHSEDARLYHESMEMLSKLFEFVQSIKKQ